MSRSAGRSAAPQQAGTGKPRSAGPAAAPHASALAAAREPAGERLPGPVRDFFEPRFGRDFSRIRVHADSAAAGSARGLHAAAYTAGPDIVFGANRYAPSTPAGRRLLAHELAHSVQQAGGVVAPGLGRPDDPHERVADEVAARVLAGRDAGALLPRPSPAHRVASPALQRQPAPAPASNPDALIPIADFITYVEAVERTFASDTPQEIVTRIRQEYYSGIAFQLLIPDARAQRLAPAHAQPPAGGTPIYYPSNLSDMRWAPDPATRSAYSHLTAHADENAVGDNPSPYIVLPDGSRLDAGHMLLGLDSLLHPRVENPYAAYGIPGIDPASWVADLALASFWTSHHERTGSPAADAPVKPPKADFEAYYNASAPTEDLLGDADSFGAFEQWGARPGQTLSQVLRAYYLGRPGTAAGSGRRWRTFCASNGLTYTVAGGTVTWDPAIEATYEPRINRLCDLFDAGFLSHASSTAAGSAPARGKWPHSVPALRRFLAWLKPRLEAELKASP